MRLFYAILVMFVLVSLTVRAETINKKTELANITAICPSEILIERGWSNYAIFSISNTGSVGLTNVLPSVSGKYSGWFEMQPTNKTIATGEKIDFASKIVIPMDTLTGSYNFSFSMNSVQIDYKKDFTVIVFNTRDDMLLYQTQNLRDQLKEMQSQIDAIDNASVNMTYAKELLVQIKTEIDLAENGVQNKFYSQVTEYIRSVEKLIIKARFEISNPAVIETNTKAVNIPIGSIVVYTPIAIVAFLLVLVVYLFQKSKLQNRVRVPNLKLKGAIVEDKRVTGLDNEINKLMESQRLLDEEYRQNMISKESYDDLRLKYQEKLMGMESERKNLRGY